MRGPSLVAAMIVASLVAAQAQTLPRAGGEAAVVSEGTQSLAGTFELSSADARRRCPVTLDIKPQGAGMSAVFDRTACVAAFPFLANVAAWGLTSRGAIRLLDGEGRVVSEFGETESGLFETVRAGEGVFFLSKTAAPEAETLNIADVVGTWSLSRTAGRPICRITFSDQTAGDGLKVTLSETCDRTVAEFQPIAWLADHGDIILISARGDSMRFERGDGGQWTKVPEAGRPLIMSR